MKIIWVILIFMVMFNIMIIFTNELGIFQITDIITASMNESELEEYSSIGMSESDVLLYGALSLEIIGIGAAAIIAAWVTKSPVPLGIGAFTAFCVVMWTRTYFTLNQFTSYGLPNELLTAGMVGMGILFVATTIEMVVGGHNA